MPSPFDELRSLLNTYLSLNDILRIEEAYQLAEKAHHNQKRFSGEEYITHPVAVTKILAEMHMDPETLISALLHDVLEDTPIQKEDIANQFGKEVMELVDGVSKLTQIHFKSRTEAQAENFRKMILAMAKDIRVMIVKLADRLHNLRTIHALPRLQQKRIAKETIEIYAPIANRLGMNNFRLEFQERGFETLHPLRARILKAAVEKMHGEEEVAPQNVHARLEAGLQKARVLAKVFGRKKGLYTIHEKMKRKHLSFGEVMDVIAFRIIVADLDTCYRVLGVVHNLYKPVPGFFKDYIAMPKANGYQSLHTILFGPNGSPIEIQIRTEEMDRVAESGIASHWLYKTQQIEGEHVAVRTHGWVRGLLEMQQNIGSSLEFLENVKVDLFPDKVYVFTPKGKIIELPQGATVIDFAYAVHTDVGENCIAAKIDRRLSPFGTKLEMGQTIEIITEQGARPHPIWLNYAVTGKARSSIRHFLKSQQKSESIVFGERLLNQALSRYQLTFETIPALRLCEVIKDFKLKDTPTLLEEIGLGYFSSLLVAYQIANPQKAQQKEAKLSLPPQPLAIQGTEGMVVRYAHCCYPIPGDSVVGFLSKGQGIVIHRESCESISKQKTRWEDKIPVQWEPTIGGEFQAGLAIGLENRLGTFAELATTLSQMGSNIDDITTKEKDGYAIYFTLVLVVKDRLHLARILRKIRALKSVIRVTRL
ncbi:MAG: bifunctional (p)ppGpp synthetase/guanosine-3',5'-bis(diphosphate) 3'-pyrophosphohydrolase [Gammaproteobacteria bacterium]|nr:bifunctional (p)ppGpp synthetase/guanosine-3',5'-bis(diphosphate) 3'-pyrophosphohydrolase [Gammaproteobacteria bacterium]